MLLPAYELCHAYYILFVMSGLNAFSVLRLNKKCEISAVIDHIYSDSIILGFWLHFRKLRL